VSPIFTRAINCKILLHQPPDDGPHEREIRQQHSNQPTTTTTRTKEQRTAPTIAAPQQQERACVSLSWVSIGWCIDLTGWLGWLVGLVGWLVLANHRAQRACIHPYSISRHDPRHLHHGDGHDHDQRNEKISNKSSFGIIDIAEQSSTSDRIIVIVKTACFIDDGAYRWRSGRHVNVSGSH